MIALVVWLLAATASALAPRPRAVGAVEPAAPAVDRRSLGRFVVAAGACALAGPGGAASAYEGVYSMDVVRAEDAVLDRDAMNSGSVKRALDEFKYYAQGVVQIREALAKNPQFNVGALLRKEYDFVKVRATFNNLTPLWDEDTQRGVDRLTRGVIQDITEAEAASKYNDEGIRTPKKLTLLTAKLDKLDGSMRKLFGYCISK